MADARDTFDMFDADHDGLVTREELGIIVRALGENPSEADVDALFKKAESGGKVSLEKFMGEIAPRMRGIQFTSEQIVEMFKVFDKDGDGHVSANEIRTVMAGTYGEPLTEAEIEEVIKLADVDGDGQIDYNEFVRLVLNKAD